VPAVGESANAGETVAAQRTYSTKHGTTAKETLLTTADEVVE